MGYVDRFAKFTPCINRTKLLIQVSSLDPEISLRTKFNVVIFELVAILLRANLVLRILTVPLVHCNFKLPWRHSTNTFLK